MGWLSKLLKCEIPCEWLCCVQNANVEINRDRFWCSVREMKETNYAYQPSQVLMFEKVFHLNPAEQTKLTIGVDPENEFAVAARLEYEHSVLRLNHKDLNSLLSFLDDYENYFSNTFSIKQTAIQYNLYLREIHARIFEIGVHGFTIDIDENSLKTLCRMKSHIQRSILSLEMIAKDCEKTLFTLLNHFYYGKTVQESMSLSEINYCIQAFFNEIIHFHCDCLDITFVLEFALHFEKLFAECVPIFVNILLLNESVRLQTYTSKYWPHAKEYIDVGKMAKSGLFYNGSTDSVQCIFCDLVLHKWKPKDDPIIDHYRFKPTCRFLKNFANTLNVSDVGNPHELPELLSILSNIRKQDDVGIDEVDHSSQ